MEKYKPFAEVMILFVVTLRRKKLLRVLCCMLAALAVLSLFFLAPFGTASVGTLPEEEDGEGAESQYIKWMEFNVPYAALEKALSLDIESHNAVQAGKEDAVALDWVDILSYLAAKYWGEFDRYRAKDIDEVCRRLKQGESMEAITRGMKLYGYYREAYGAVLDGLVGLYHIGEDGGEGIVWEERYGLKAYSPIAATFPFSHFDDFGTARSYGYKRRHLGHDMMAEVGTPVICVETGVIEEMGWNRYGGWRLGIRSLDGKRYYYYAHFRKDRPYSASVEKGKLVYAGDVIGYVGRTGYSVTENTNNIKQSHLHWGIQIIFDESQKDGANQIWVDVYALTRLLQKHKSETVRDSETKEHTRKYYYDEPLPEGYAADGPLPEEEQGAGAVRLPVIMYHSILKSARNSPYVITPAQLEADLSALREMGYETVTVEDLVRFVNDGIPLPEKPIMLTFDDGHYNNIYYAAPLLKEYGMRAVLAVVGAYSDQSEKEGDVNPNYSYVTWEMMSDPGLTDVFEVQNHSYNMHIRGARQGCRKKPGEDLETYFQAVTADLEALQDKIYTYTGRRPDAFVYPFGAIDSDLERLLKDLGFAASMSCVYGINTITPGDTDCLFAMKRNLRNGKLSAQDILRKYHME